MEKYRFTVIIEKDEDGKYVASVPALPGCRHTQADNLNDLEARIHEAIKLCLDVYGKDNIQTGGFIGVHEVEVAL